MKDNLKIREQSIKTKWIGQPHYDIKNDASGYTTMSEQVQVMVKQDDLVDEVTRYLLLTKGEDIYEAVEGNKGDALISSWGWTCSI